MEDLNFLYYRQQVALIKASECDCPQTRREHERLVRLYDMRIRQARTDRRKAAPAA